MSLQIRPETSEDVSAITQLTIEAFDASEFGHQGEADLVEQLRLSEPDCLSLVACDETRVIGHVFFSPTEIRAGSHRTSGMGLAPMAVLPAEQGRGVGSALIDEGLKSLLARNCQFVAVLGHPDYYPRFQFEPANQFGIQHGFQGIPQDVFFIRSLSGQTLPKGKFYYASEFGPQHSP